MSAPLPVVVIVGAGHAGAEAATAIRQGGHAGAIVLVGAEARLPYHRPPLSKGYLAGSTTAEALQLKAIALYEKAGVELRLGTPVQAPGSRPRRLSAPGLDPQRAPANLHYLRTIDDIDRLRPGFVAGARLLIIGGGYIGLEAAAVARKAGLAVTVLEAEPRVLARVAARPCRHSLSGSIAAPAAPSADYQRATTRRWCAAPRTGPRWRCFTSRTGS